MSVDPLFNHDSRIPQQRWLFLPLGKQEPDHGDKSCIFRRLTAWAAALFRAEEAECRGLAGGGGATDSYREGQDGYVASITHLIEDVPLNRRNYRTKGHRKIR